MISGFAAPHLPGSGIYQTAGFTRQRDLPDSGIYQTAGFIRQRDLSDSGIYQAAGFIGQRAAKRGTVSQNHLTPTTKLPIMERLELGDAWALELLLRE